MDALLAILACYLVVGAAAIFLLDLLTGRVRSKLRAASLDVIVLTGSAKAALAVTLIALWVFWPAAIYAAVRR